MKSAKNILIAFLLNLAFSLFEFAGGIFTGSVAIMSDALHDLGDAAGIGVSFFLERKSRKSPDETYTYGYARYSILGSLVSTVILLSGSVMVIAGAVSRILNPVAINYDGMIVFAVVGVVINLAAAMVTRHGDSLNQRAVNLHMLEDVLGWAVVLAGAVIMRFTDISLIDPILSVAVALFILVHATGHLREALDLFLEKVPEGVSPTKVREHILAIPGIADVHHIHLWSMDGVSLLATMHVVTAEDSHRIKDTVRHELLELGINHVTLELESPDESCLEKCCNPASPETGNHHHHHHHHH